MATLYTQKDANIRKTWVLMTGFFIMVIAIGWGVSFYFDNQAILYISILLAVVMNIASYWWSDKLVVAMTRAQPADENEYRELHRIVENLAISAGLPKPTVYIVNDPAPNAFATGRDPKHAAVAATTGILDIMTDTELEGVFAHELGHIKNYDIRVSMIAFALVGVVSLLCDFFLRISFWGGGMGDDSDEGGSNIMMLLAIVALVLAPVVATLMQLAISRKREYLADATGALTTRYPEGLARALEKIQAGGSTMRKQNTSTAHFFIANPLKRKSLSSLLSTHPPIEERIKILRNMSGEK
jgi:heat shock protein HtpX